MYPLTVVYEGVESGTMYVQLSEVSHVLPWYKTKNALVADGALVSFRNGDWRIVKESAEQIRDAVEKYPGPG